MRDFLALSLLIAGLILVFLGWQTQKRPDTSSISIDPLSEQETRLTGEEADALIRLTQPPIIDILAADIASSPIETATPPSAAMPASLTPTLPPKTETPPATPFVVETQAGSLSTNTPTAQSTKTETATIAAVSPTATITPTNMPRPIIPAPSIIIPPPPQWERFGITTPAEGFLSEAAERGLQFGSYLNWGTSVTNPGNFWQMIRIEPDGYDPPRAALSEVITAQPGSYWIIGNEMDIFEQDYVAADRYVDIYHELYWLIKEQDPTAKVVIGAVSQPTPLRRAYLDLILDSYQNKYRTPMPIDVWNVHAFILHEEAGQWGAGIPPGLNGPGDLYEIDQHTDIEIFQQNIIDFRAWMAERGYGNRPLVVSEYGVLLPAEYGFPPEHVADFMTQTFDFFLTAANPTGYAADNNRLVQWWFWYSLYDPYDFPSGDMYNPDTGELTVVGQAYINYPK